MLREAGQAIYEIIHPALQEGQEVRLDFSGVKVFSSPFLNAAIGQLVRDVATDHLNRQLKVENMTSAGRVTLRVVIETAKDYYADDGAKQAIDEAVVQQALTG